MEDGSGNVVSSSVEKLEDMVQKSAEAVQKMASAISERIEPGSTAKRSTESGKEKIAKGSTINASSTPPSAKKIEPKNYEELRVRLNELERLEELAESAKRADRNKLSAKQWKRGFFTEKKRKKQVSFQPSPQTSKAFSSCVGGIKERRGPVMRGPPQVNNERVNGALFDIDTRQSTEDDCDDNLTLATEEEQHSIFDDPNITLEPPPGFSRFKAQRLRHS
uniref:Uncharacterized protein n=1 Tax=Aureoumbra lagunensis TaxID=44058 RepID=A0A7S3K0J9_9STRA